MNCCICCLLQVKIFTPFYQAYSIYMLLSIIPAQYGYHATIQTLFMDVTSIFVQFAQFFVKFNDSPNSENFEQ